MRGLRQYIVDIHTPTPASTRGTRTMIKSAMAAALLEEDDLI